MEDNKKKFVDSFSFAATIKAFVNTSFEKYVSKQKKS